MAVANPGMPNYGGAYESIANTISRGGERQAAMELQRPAPPLTQALGLASNIAAQRITTGIKSADEQKQMEAKRKEEEKLADFKFGLEDRLNKNKEDYKLAGEGKIAVTQELVNNFYEQRGLNIKYAPKITGTMHIPQQDLQKMIEVETLAGEATDPKVKAYIRAFPTEGKVIAEKMFPELRKESKERRQFVKDTERNITYEVTPEGLVPAVGMKPSGEKKSLDDMEKNDRKEFVSSATKFKTDVLKPKRDAWDAANSAINALKASNPILDTGVRVKMAKAFGDTGNIALVEQAQYGGSPEAAEVVKNMLSKQFTGKISENNRKYLIQAAEALKKGTEDAVSTAMQSEVDTAKGSYDVNRKFAAMHLGGSWGSKIYVPEFESEEDARAAGYENGDIIKIGGVKGILE